ncbi:MAG: Rieske (2Fe-2S) protein [Chloroflexi bacterium]|nr:Rieske (2Fe-2S) protein [Chloroflexota bacterium]
MAKHTICRVAELPPGERKILEIEGRSIGVFNVAGQFYALRNSCPHQAAPLCKGSVRGMTISPEPGVYQYVREGEILRCPWHGWEFDLTNGRSIYNPHKVRVRSYQVTVEPDDEDPSVETYQVTVERGRVVLHV